MMRTIAFLLLVCFSLPACAESGDNPHIKAAFALARTHAWTAAADEAKAGGSPILAKYFTWEYMKDPLSEATFSEISDFIDDNPEWPDKAAMLKHAEVELLADNPSDSQLNDWFAKHPPQTILAKRMGVRSKEELDNLIREAWVTDEYNKDTEAKLLARYQGILRPKDHARRVDRLLWEGKSEEAKRLLKYVSYDERRLFQARLSLAADKERAPVDVVNVPPSLQGDLGLTYERLRWRIRGGDKDGARELLLQTPSQIPYAEKWWPLRDRQIREALGEGDVKLASRLLANHGQKEGTLSFKEAKWLEGWIDLRFKNEPQKAYGIFTKLADETETPAGKSRVDYWAGRAAAAGGGGSASHWYAEAAHYPTTFYGQLAAMEGKNESTLSIRSEEEPSASDKARFRKRELVQLVHALAAAHESDMAGKFILYLVDDAESPAEAILATRLGREIDRIDFGVRAAKKALSSDIVSLSSGWPVIRFHSTQGIETPLLLALSRQESEFYADAISPSGALGLMQLLPGTAKEMARKNGIAYSSDRLFDPDYNMTLGSLYLRKMLDRFNGSYVLAIASYNAGPGRIGQWLELYGNPGSNVHDALDWIERIPTTETRNYVQHVIANMEVYRYVLSGHSSVQLAINEDLVR